MLVSPLLLGALASGPGWIHLLLAAFWFAGYFAFNATSLWLKSGRKVRYLRPVQVYAALAAALGLATALEEGLSKPMSVLSAYACAPNRRRS